MAAEYLERTPTSTGNRSVYTWAGWVKRNRVDQDYYLFSSGKNSLDIFYISIRRDANNNNLTVLFRDGDSTSHTLVFDNNSFRDPSSWMHFVVSVNTTIVDPKSDRCKVYINGARLTGWTTDELANLDQNSLTVVNTKGETGAIGDYSVSDGGDVEDFQLFDYFLVDGQALTPDVFGFYKDGDGYQSSGTTQATDFRSGQWSPRLPKSIKYTINRSGGFGVNGFYLPMNDSSNPGADFHCAPNSIIKLKGEDLPQPRNGAPVTSDAYVSQLRSDPFAANLVLAIPGITGGQGSGFGDYSADIKGSGTNKTILTTNSPTISSDASLYYGSSIKLVRASAQDVYTTGINETIGTGDFTLEGWFRFDSRSEDINAFNLYSGSTRKYFTQFRVTNASPDFHSRLGINQIQYNSGTIGWSDAHIGNWFHVATVMDSGTFSIFLNGVCVGVHNNVVEDIGSVDTLRIGYLTGDGTKYLDGYFQDFRFYNVAKYKGGFDVPKPYTPVGIESWRTTADTCKNNFATLNPLYRHVSSNTYTNGNLKAVAQGNNEVTTGNMAFSSGKWYWETRIFNDEMIGLGIPSQYLGGYPGQNTNGLSYHQSGNVYYNGTTSYGVGWTGSTYRVIGFAVDWTNRRAYWSVDGVWHNSADPSAGTGFYDITVNASQVAASVDALPAWRSRSSSPSEQVSVNFGQNPSFGGELTAGTNADDSGKGLFKYAPPTGFLALCEDNLPTPAIADPGKHFKSVLYTGDGNGGRSITGVGFQPDLVWVKRRNAAASHFLVDSVRGAGKFLQSHTTAAEGDDATNTLMSFDSNGFTSGNTAGMNGSTDQYVAWCWKAGGAAVSNTDGTLASQVSVNQDAGFSIVNWTSNGATSVVTTGHGLAKTPKFMLLKNRDAVDNWFVYHSDIQTNDRQYLRLNTTVDTITSPNDFWSTSSSTFGIRQSSIANNTNRVIAYVWTEIEGFSKFGSYVGNGNADGTFVYCGFKPAWVMVRRTLGENWAIIDSSRSPSNPADLFLRADESAIETSAAAKMDFLSNGFKLRGTDTKSNGDGDTYIFAAFAESPFQTANAK